MTILGLLGIKNAIINSQSGWKQHSDYSVIAGPGDTVTMFIYVITSKANLRV